MINVIEEAGRTGTVWARGLMSAARELSEDLIFASELSEDEIFDSVSDLLREALASLNEERGAEFARAFGDAAKLVMGKCFLAMRFTSLH